MSNLALTPTQKSVLINPAYTGNEQENKTWLPIINILQSDKQYEAFGEDGNKITKAMYGKLFIRKDNRNGDFNKLEDLATEITGTVMKIQYGHEIYSLDEKGQRDKLLESNVGLIPSAQRDQWTANNPGKIYKNMVKIILATKSADETQADTEANKNPFCILTIKGSGWGSWFDTQKEMDAQAMASPIYEHKRASDLAVTVFKFIVSSQKNVSDDGFTSFVPAIKIEMNKPEEATKFYGIARTMEIVDLFNKKIVEKTNTSSVTMKEATEIVEQVAEPTQEAEIVDTEEYLNSLK